jgi:class 3 adenylate cyclase/tetratricopeptide (TPR) repeat protein
MTDEGSTAPLSESLVSYVPAVVASRLAEHPFPIEVPRADAATGVCLSLDIAGFTPLAERLARRGAAGAEQMAEILNGAFGPLVAVCDAHGGEIMEFEGDALLALWRAADPEGLKELALRATACGLALQGSAKERRTWTDAALSMKVAVAAGPLQIIHVGGVDGRKRCLATGLPIAELGELERQAPRDGVVVSGRVADLLADGYEGARNGESGATTVHSLRSPPRPRPLERPQVPPEAWSALLEYTPSRLDTHLIGSPEAWLSEFRRVTSVFVNLVGLEHGAPGELERLDASVQAVQRIVGRYEGSLEKLIEGAKGTLLLVAFGLPPGIHEDDPTRAARAALEIEDAIATSDLRSAIGITTGVAFAGPVGGPIRRDLTIVGDVVNIAARLMQAAENDILCDRATALALDGIAHEGLSPLTVKGKSTPVSVFRVHGELAGAVHEGSKRLPMVDRQRERALLDDALERLEEGVGSVVVVEGEAGIGKSRLLEDLVEQAEARGARVKSGSGDAIESSTPYLAWRPILWDALGLESAPADHGARRRHVLRWLRAHSLPPEEVSLLNNVIELRLPESRSVSRLTPNARVERTRDLVARVLAAAAGTDPTVIVIEDAHFLDSASWGLATRVRDELSGALLVLSSRPVTEAVGERAEALTGAIHIVLDRLDDRDTVELVRVSLGVERLGDDVRDLVLRRAEGHPFFSQELAISLRDSGTILGDGGVARIAERSGDAAAVPDTIQGVVASRIDHLEAPQQMLLKVASVLGRTFDLEPVRDLFPDKSERTRIANDLKAIEERGLIEATTKDRRSFTFGHAIVRDVAYQSMLHAQRRELHRAAALWLEARSTGGSQAREPILAHHWLQAAGQSDDIEALGKAELHLTRAGLNALRQGAFVEAESFLSDAHSCHVRLPDDLRDQLREIEILRHLTTASFATHGFGSPEVTRTSRRTYELAQGRLAGPDLFPILWGLWLSTHFQHGSEAIALGDRLMEIAEDENDDELRLQAHHALWTSLIQVPDYARARRHIEAGIVLYRPEWHERHCAEYGGHDPGSCAERAAAMTAWTTGLVDQAVADGREAVRLAQDHPFSVPNAMLALAFVHRQRGDLDAVTVEARALRQRAVERGLLTWVDWAAVLEAWARGKRGDVEGGIAEMKEAVARLGLKDPGYMAMLVELYGLAGRTSDGLRLVDELLDLVERTGERSYEPELLRLRGELLAAVAGREEEAEGYLRRAVRVADEQGALSFSLRAATDLARLLSHLGRGDEAAALLRRARDRFTEGFETADLVEADELLTLLELGRPSPKP